MSVPEVASNKVKEQPQLIAVTLYLTLVRLGA